MASGGHLGVLIQPGEYIIILGAVMGSFFASQTKYSFGLILKSIKHIFGDPGMSKNRYLETLALLYSLFVKMQREGVISTVVGYAGGITPNPTRNPARP